LIISGIDADVAFAQVRRPADLEKVAGRSVRDIDSTNARHASVA